jgi:glutamate racemase
MDNRPIGIFDSGVGGLTVTGRVMQVMENEKIVYFGDTARVPYGSKGKETITRFSCQDVRFLLSQDVKAVIVACNTASSNSLDDLKSTFDVPVFGVVEPGAAEASKCTKNKKIGIIATEATTRSKAYEKEIKKADSSIEVFSKACPLFVPLAEEGWCDNEIAYLTAEKYLKPLLEKGVDTIILGCTHYPLLRNCIQKVAGEKVTLVDPAYETAIRVRKYLFENNMMRSDKQKAEHKFFVSDTTKMFDRICSEALKTNYKAQEINIEQY